LQTSNRPSTGLTPVDGSPRVTAARSLWLFFYVACANQRALKSVIAVRGSLESLDQSQKSDSAGGDARNRWYLLTRRFMRLFSGRTAGALANLEVGPPHLRQHARSAGPHRRHPLGACQLFFEQIWLPRFHVALLRTGRTSRQLLPALEATSHYPATHDYFESEQLDGKKVRKCDSNAIQKLWKLMDCHISDNF
jgi:hypothetical protein